MILYVDETENEQFFIVAGLLVNNEYVVNDSYKRFKHMIKNCKLSNKAKTKIYTEFKSTILDSHYQNIKIKMLKIVNEINNQIVYTFYIKKIKNLKQKNKEEIYIDLLLKIINSINMEIFVVFDKFNNLYFENMIYRKLIENKNVLDVKAADSQQEPGLQYIDNICSVLRLNVSNLDKNNFYSLIKSKIIYCK